LTPHRSWSRLGCLFVLACALALTACSPAPPTHIPTAVPTETPRPASWAPPPQTPGPVEVSYVDNCGFLITGAGKKILVDAHHLGVPDGIRQALEKAQPPFDAEDLILITHNHGDHFDPNVLGRHLQACPQAVVVTTDEVVQDMQRTFEGYDQVKDRFLVQVPAKAQRLQLAVNGIGLEVLNLPHGPSPPNVGFIIHLAGKKLLHTGDTANPALPGVYNVRADGLDLAFVQLYYILMRRLPTDRPSPAVSVIGAKRIVPMHYALAEVEDADFCAQLLELCPEIMLFRTRLEPQVLP